MEVSVLTAMLIWAATAIGVPTPPMPVIYPAVPEQQICAMVMDRPCNPSVRLRKDTGPWLGVAAQAGAWVAVSTDLEIGSTYWKGVLVHEFVHVAQAFANRPQSRRCRPVNEHQATLAMAAWFRAQGTSYVDVTGWNIAPFEAVSSEEIRLCGSPHLHIEEKRDDHRTQSIDPGPTG